MSFSSEIQNLKPKNTLKNEHLNKGVRPILGGIFDRNNADDLDKETQANILNLKSDAEFVDFLSDKDEAERKKMYNSGKKTYIISTCNEKNKFSLSYLNCTGVVAVGTDKETGENISFLSHQDPEHLFKDDEIRSNFKRDLMNDLDNLIERCVPGTIDIVILGGNKEDVSNNFPEEDFRMGIDDIDEILKGPYDTYTKSVRFLNNLIYKKIGFSSVVLIEPNSNFKTDNNSLDVYFDNKNRRLYMVGPKNEKILNNGPFIASDVDEREKGFKR